MRIIGLMGAEQAGKSTVAKYLRAQGFETVSFAGPFKLMLEVLGLSPEQLHGSEKEVPTDKLCGKTPRHAMKTLGSEWGRRHIGDDIWVKALRDQLIGIECIEPGGLYVIEDVRFDNEVRMIESLGGEIWLIRRQDVEPRVGLFADFLRFFGFLPRLHASQTGWMRMEEPARLIWNNGTKLEFENAVRTSFLDWLELHGPVVSDVDDSVSGERAVPLPVEDEEPATIRSALETRSIAELEAEQLLLGSIREQMVLLTDAPVVSKEKEPPLQVADITKDPIEAEVLTTLGEELLVLDKVEEIQISAMVAMAESDDEVVAVPAVLVAGVPAAMATDTPVAMVAGVPAGEGEPLQCIVGVFKPIYVGAVSAEQLALDEASAQAAIELAQSGVPLVLPLPDDDAHAIYYPVEPIVVPEVNNPEAVEVSAEIPQAVIKLRGNRKGRHKR